MYEETNVLWRVIANERRAHQRCSGTDRGTAARPAAACSALTVVSHRLGAPEAAVGAESGSCGEEQTEVRCWYFGAVAPSAQAPMTAEPLVTHIYSQGSVSLESARRPRARCIRCQQQKQPFADPAAESLGAFFREPANLCACCSKPGT